NVAPVTPEPEPEVAPEAAPAPEPEPVAAPEPAPPPPPPAEIVEEAEPFEPDPAEALALAPDPGLILQGQVGLLPVIGEDGRQPWHVYARPVDLDEDMPKIAIVIGGLGMSEAATTAAIQQLPGTVTLAFVPYAPDLSSWIARARAAGHEVILQLPMEPLDFPANDPGPHTLMTDAEAAENIERLHWLLSRFTGYVGVTNYMGSKMTTSPEAMFPILEDIQARGLMFLDAMETPDSIAGQLASEMHMPNVVNNRFLDTQASRVSIDARLFELEAIAEATGGAVGIGFPYPVTIERVSAWMATLEDRGIAVVPLSALAEGDAPVEEEAAGGGH
ncbi:MAG: divergent polysaccharide deacetylase family protein, partial [Alphaproteobacteria bacterium]|nr:divergent polysaccharide deacetylase family protein [Alphaproteobacteria bacterium]